MRLLLLCFASCLPALAQPSLNILTITATRNLNLQPDQASLMVNVTSSVITALDDVLAALQPTNVTAANFIGVSTTFTGANGATEAWYWTFTLTVPLSGLSATLSSLAALQQSLPAAQNPMTLDYYVQSASYSPQLLASNPCPYTAVFSDAQTQAQIVAAAAGRTVGPVVALSDGSRTAMQPAGEYVSGVISAVLVSSAVFLESQAVSPAAPSCAMVGQFRLGQ